MQHIFKKMFISLLALTVFSACTSSPISQANPIDTQAGTPAHEVVAFKEQLKNGALKESILYLTPITQAILNQIDDDTLNNIYLNGTLSAFFGGNMVIESQTIDGNHATVVVTFYFPDWSNLQDASIEALKDTFAKLLLDGILSPDGINVENFKFLDVLFDYAMNVIKNSGYENDVEVTFSLVKKGDSWKIELLDGLDDVISNFVN